MLTPVNLFSIVGQQWTEDNQVGKVVDGTADFEGNGVFSKLLLDVSVVYLYWYYIWVNFPSCENDYFSMIPLKCLVVVISIPEILFYKKLASDVCLSRNIELVFKLIVVSVIALIYCV